MNRAERVAQATKLRKEGLIYREIAERMGVCISTAQALVADPDGAKDKARKAGFDIPYRHELQA